MCDNDEHALNEYLPTEVTDVGIVIWVMFEHPSKALCPIEVIVEGIVNSFKERQL